MFPGNNSFLIFALKLFFFFFFFSAIAAARAYGWILVALIWKAIKYEFTVESRQSK